MRYIHTTEYYSALKRKEMLSYATTWLNLEDIILSEISHRKMNSVKYVMTYNTVLAKKFVRVVPQHLTEKLNKLLAHPI